MRKLLIFLVLFYSLLAAQAVNKQTTDIIDDSTTFQLSVDYMNGWNMVSIPGNLPNGNSTENWLLDYHHSIPIIEWGCGYAPPLPPCNVTTLSPTKGYWIRFSEARTFNTCDEWPCSGIIKFPHNSIPNNSGWNMVGFYEDTILTADLIAANPIIISTIWGFNGEYFPALYLLPGYAYFVRNSQAGDIHVPSSRNKYISKVESETNYPKLIINDASGKSFTLYSLNGNIDSDKYLMPPPPPAGSFDVRYSSGRSAENLESGEHGIDLSGVKYPVTITTDNLTIRVRDISGKLLDAILKPGESVNISDIDKLFVSSVERPQEYSLGQNYPNPFNPSTQIEYAIEKAGLVTLKVYNSIGEEVQTLVNEVQEPGKYKIQFNTTALSSGVYLYKITSGDFVQTRKMTLLK